MADPVETIQATKRQALLNALEKSQTEAPLAAVRPAFENTVDVLLGALGLGPDTTANKAGALAGAALPVVGSLKGIRAFHGSPHDFEKFSMQRVGTGEGAQAYGHGLYFSENPEVAADYARRVGTHGSVTDPTVLAQYFTPGQIVEGYGGPDRVLEFRPGSSKSGGWSVRVQRVNAKGEPVEAPRVHATAPSLTDVRKTLTPGRQGLYEVQIHADPESLLDWDKPMSQQNARVHGVAAESPKHSLGFQRDFLKQEPSGQALYTNLAGTQHQRSVEASQALKDAGIPGIQYLDQGSRIARQGTHNYVIFDEKLIEILKKYGIVLPLAGLGPAAKHQVLMQTLGTMHDQ